MKLRERGERERKREGEREREGGGAVKTQIEEQVLQFLILHPKQSCGATKFDQWFV